MSINQAITGFVLACLWFATMLMIAMGHDAETAIMLSVGGTTAFVLQALMVRLFLQ